jgi:hypothetical protein
MISFFKKMMFIPVHVFVFTAPLMYPTQVQVHSHSSNAVKVTFQGVAIGVLEEPLKGYKARIYP